MENVKLEINPIENNVIICECGSIITRKSLQRHIKKSVKHRFYVLNLERRKQEPIAPTPSGISNKVDNKLVDDLEKKIIETHHRYLNFIIDKFPNMERKIDNLLQHLPDQDELETNEDKINFYDDLLELLNLKKDIM